jgi:CRISPR/Cas system CSM-associated protein Csm2 small subunit
MKKELIKKEDKVIKVPDDADVKNMGINAITGEPFIIPKDNDEWIKNREIDKDGSSIIITPSGKKLELKRRGVDAKELGAIMLSDDLTKDEKNKAVSQYIAQEFSDNGMFVAEIFQSRGTYTKEARHFYSQMRFDFENFAGIFQRFLEDRAKSIIKLLELSKSEIEKIIKDLPKVKGDIHEALLKSGIIMEKSQEILLEFAIACLNESDALKDGIDRLTKERERLKGGGSYISKNGNVYNLNDIDIAEVVQKEWEENQKNNK